MSRPSKLPWWSWSIPASACHTGGKLAQQENTVCSSCYALKGFYMFPAAQNAMQRRLEALDNPRFVEAFVIVLNHLLAKTRKKRSDGSPENRFRWLDSGDLQGVDMLDKINQIALATPAVQHWLPTREAGYVSEFLKTRGGFAPNLCVRLSVPMVGQAPPRRPQGLPFATVGVDNHPGLHQCPALSKQGNKCLDCDSCWRRAVDVNYPLH